MEPTGSNVNPKHRREVTEVTEVTSPGDSEASKDLSPHQLLSELEICQDSYEWKETARWRGYLTGVASLTSLLSQYTL